MKFVTLETLIVIFIVSAPSERIPQGEIALKCFMFERTHHFPSQCGLAYPMGRSITLVKICLSCPFIIAICVLVCTSVDSFNQVFQQRAWKVIWTF